jgi:hypothetical protein
MIGGPFGINPILHDKKSAIRCSAANPDPMLYEYICIKEFHAFKAPPTLYMMDDVCCPICVFLEKFTHTDDEKRVVVTYPKYLNELQKNAVIIGGLALNENMLHCGNPRHVPFRVTLEETGFSPTTFTCVDMPTVWCKSCPSLRSCGE